MFKRVFSFILIMVMSIFVITANAQKDVYFAKYRYVQNEYGEILPRFDREAYCPTRIEIDYDAKTLIIKTKTHGTASYKFNDYSATKDATNSAVSFYNAKGEEIGGILFNNTNYSDFEILMINRKNNTLVAYKK